MVGCMVRYSKQIGTSLLHFLLVYAILLIQIGILFWLGVLSATDPLVLMLLGVFILSAFVTPFAFFKTWNKEEN